MAAWLQTAHPPVQFHAMPPGAIGLPFGTDKTAHHGGPAHFLSFSIGIPLENHRKNGDLSNLNMVISDL